MKVKLVGWVALAGLMCIAFPTYAAEVKLTSSTQYLWFNDIIADDDVETVAQYLRLNMSKLDQAGKITSRVRQGDGSSRQAKTWREDCITSISATAT
jgi:hypothetical protein